MGFLTGGYYDWDKIAKNVAMHPITAMKNVKDRWLSGQGALDAYSAKIARAQAADSNAYGTNRFRAVPKADGGFDYYKDNMLISEDDWVRESGLNPPSSSDWIQTAGLANEYANQASQTTNTLTQNTSGDGGGDGGGGNEYIPQWFNQELYPTLEGLSAAQRQYAEDIYNQNLAGINRNYGVQGGSDGYWGDIGMAEAKTNTDYDKIISELQKAYEAGRGSITSQFERVAPSLFQSAQQIAETNIGDKKQEGVDTATTEKTDILGNIGRSKSDLTYGQTTEKSALQDQYNQMLDKISNQLEQEKYYNKANIDSAVQTPQVYAPTEQGGYSTPDLGAISGYQAPGLDFWNQSASPSLKSRTARSENPGDINNWLYKY